MRLKKISKTNGSVMFMMLSWKIRKSKDKTSNKNISAFLFFEK